LSKKTVDEHIDNACKTFGVNGRIQAVVRALRLGLLDLNS
jgi:DNA-binding NarL/FixJ family response regulator